MATQTGAAVRTRRADAETTATATRSASDKQDAILNAAEAVFAESGFAGASMREIAERAGVAQALIHYHFETKEKLFEAMAARRANAINGTRAEQLGRLLDGDGTITLEAVIESLFRPTIEAGNRFAREGGSFARILVSIANSHNPRDQQIAETYYDPIALKFIDALCRAEPGLSRPKAVWAYMFSIGVGMTMMAQTGRSTRLSDGACDDSDAEAMLTEIITYACGGVRALAASREEARPD